MAKPNQEGKATDTVLLDGQLRAYSAAARVSNPAGSFQRRLGHWSVYAAATGSALAMATSASASIIYCGTSNGCLANSPSVTAPAVGTHKLIQPINLDGAGHFFNLRGSGGKSVSSTSLGAKLTAIFGLVDVLAANPIKIFDIAGHSSAKNFAAGAVITSAAGVQKNTGLISKKFFSTAGFGNFTSGKTGFAGLEIIATANHPSTNFGWIRLLFTESKGVTTKLTAVDWAVQSSNGVTIHAGEGVQGPSTPEPGTMALGLLASGAIGILEWKRRRRQEA